MSLDVYLYEKIKEEDQNGSGIFIREDGRIREITREEWEDRFPGTEPVIFKKDEDDSGQVYWDNITHNLGQMAGEAGIYKHLWRPEELRIEKAGQLIDPLSRGLDKLKADPEKFMRFNPVNGWGSYFGLVQFVENYLDACISHPNADIEVSR